MSAVRILNGGYPLATYLIVHMTGDDDHIGTIEMWVDQPTPWLIYDDIQMANLSAAVQASITTAVDEYLIQKAERARRLAQINKALQQMGLPTEHAT